MKTASRGCGACWAARMDIFYNRRACPGSPPPASGVRVMAAGSDDSTGGGFQPLRSRAPTQDGAPIMTDQPAGVTPGEISALLSHARQLGPGTSLDEQIAYHERKASLLSRCAADLGSVEAHEVAADAWHYVAGPRRRPRAPADPGARPRRSP